MTIQDLTNRVAQRVSIDPAIAEQAIGTILSIIQIEGRGNKVGELFVRLPGAADLARRYSIADIKAEDISGLVTLMLGSKARALMNGIALLHSFGLTSGQIKVVGHEVAVFATENCGRSVVREVTRSIPGLRAKLAA